MNRWVLILAGILVGIVIGASTLYLAEPVGRYQMAIIPATPIHQDRLVILNTVTGEGKVFTNKFVRNFSYKLGTFSELREPQSVSNQ